MSCTDTNPLTRDGATQIDRLLAALDIHYADVDERSAADLILFARRYAEYLAYYDRDNKKEGTWQPIMMTDISVILATLSSLDTRSINDYKRLLYKNITRLPDTPDRDQKAMQQFKYLFDTVLSLMRIIDTQYMLLPDDEYKTIIGDIITTRLRLNLAYFDKKVFRVFIDTAPPLLDYAATELDSRAPIDVQSDGSFRYTASVSAIWWDVAEVDIDQIPSLTITGSVYEEILQVINHNIFNSIIDSLLKGAAMIVTRSKELFAQTMANFPGHAPHYGLFLAFTRLYKVAQDELNLYTKHHLDFYYKDVLRLVNKLPQPDKAHLTFELQKPVQQLLLTKGTLFKGGKDIIGKDISYALTGDVVLNKASVAAVQAQHIDLRATSIKPLRAFPIAASEDGAGAKLISEDKSWYTFGNPRSALTALPGFAIASNLLFLKEGLRTITISVAFETEVTELAGESKLNLHAEISGHKAWMPAPVTGVSYDNIGHTATITIRLDENAPAVIPYSEKLHKQNFETALPLLKIFFDEDVPGSIPYARLCKYNITNIGIKVNVQGVRDLILSNDNGSIDASKPFKPFGDFPTRDSCFYIGSKEVFQKKLTELSWQYGINKTFGVDPKFLNEGRWDDYSKEDFKPGTIDFSPNEALRSTTLNGFIKLRHGSNRLSMKKYMVKLQGRISQTTIKPIDRHDVATGTQLNVAATPVPGEFKVSDFRLTYAAADNISFTSVAPAGAPHTFYHITPLGYSPVIYDGTVPALREESIQPYTLVRDVICNGELYIGLTDAETETVVTILCEVADGSSNPISPIEPLMWYYLAGDRWIAFRRQDVVDDTRGLLRSGIVTLSLPPDMTDRNTLLRKGLYWIKAAVAGNIDAVCKMIQVTAQAGTVQLVQDEATGIEFHKLIAAGSISKAVQSNAAIKTITQPFDGWGGRPRETDEHFYTRVSERLRHKQRAITIWDYEHITLEQFPQLYKVKCINHSGFYDSGDGEVFCENFPGHVSIVTIPDLTNNTNTNRLRPYTPVGLLDDIKAYLIKLTSPFVVLHVKNPQFEEIQLDFKVKFYDGYDERFYEQQLSRDIEQYLCPWAFDTGIDIPFGSKVIKSALINFVEERPYVDFVSCFEMNHIVRENGMIIYQRRNIEEAIATTSRSVLVSYYDEETRQRHIINPVETCEC